MSELPAQSVLSHLHELKRRLAYAVLAYVAGVVFCFMHAERILQGLMLPLQAAGLRHDFRMIFTALPEVFMAHLQLALVAGFVVAFPIIAAQVWIFMAPALYKHERHTLLPFFLGAPLLFMAGMALAFFAAMPTAWKFFLSYETASMGQIPILAETRVQDYVGMTLQFLLAFGLVFQTPLALLLAARLGWVTAAQLAASRRWAIVIILMIAAILTPTPDIAGQILLALPLWLLFEISIILIRLQHARPKIHPTESSRL